jgi:hypothetical protein
MTSGMFDGLFTGLIIFFISVGIAISAVAIILWKYVLSHISISWVP